MFTVLQLRQEMEDYTLAKKIRAHGRSVSP